ncbi:thiamine monophosphate synthase [Thioploca ingrica]|uniref:Thiamine-phosphate synthase n=1 Tax=Thioploca ingrica TaxID=40754 RepID=A0A090AHA9_9GAMM|nr:thiamine monophosphate synthase [Thioploca ingrica]
MIPLRGLYAITDSHLIPSFRFVATVEEAIQGGARVVQYRDKSDNKKQRFQQAQALHHLCQQYQIPLIINDDVDLAQQVGAEGVHLGKEDAQLTTVRARLGHDVIIGVSCYNQLALAQDAVAAGATYVAFGRFFQSHTKPNAVVAHLDLLRQARQLLHCPIVAIGGITPDNGKQLITAGADCLAVIQGVFGQPNRSAAAQRYAQLF